MKRLIATEADAARYAGAFRTFFGPDPKQIIEVPGGWSARAFRVDADGCSYFLKVFDRTKQSTLPWIQRIDHYVPVQGFLAETEALRGRISAPMRALHGGYKAELGDEVFLALHYIEGTTPGYGHMTRGQIVELAGILARLHGFGEDIPADVSGLKEDISLWFCDHLADHLDGAEVYSVVEPRRAMLREAVRQTIRLRDEVRQNAEDIHLCHTDAHGGNVMQAERLVLVDWEGLCLGPAEADLFMYYGDSCWDDFMAAYCAARPGFALSRDMLRFYLIRRQVEDIWYYLMELLRDKPAKPVVEEIHCHLFTIMDVAERLLEGGI